MPRESTQWRAASSAGGCLAARHADGSEGISEIRHRRFAVRERTE